jgi:hypothetical protein
VGTDHEGTVTVLWKQQLQTYQTITNNKLIIARKNNNKNYHTLHSQQTEIL